MNKLSQAIEFAKSGNKVQARQYLKEVIQADQNNETAWLWMAGVVETTDQQIRCLEQVIRINPNNQNAAMALSRLGVKDGTEDVHTGQHPDENDSLHTTLETPTSDNDLPLPDVARWSNGFRGWSIVEKVGDVDGTSSQLGLLINEAHVATNRMFGWAAVFILLAVLFGFLITVDFGSPFVLAGISLVFLAIAAYRIIIWYGQKDLKAGIYREGFTLEKDGRKDTVYWSDVEYVKEDWLKQVYQGIIHIYRHKVEIYRSNGEKLEMDRSLDKIEQVGRLIQLAVADALLPATIERLAAGQFCDFGNFTISRQGIDHKNKNFLSWQEIHSLEVGTMGQTIVKIRKVNGSKKGGTWATESGGSFKNLQLFLGISQWFINASHRLVDARMESVPPSQPADDGDVHYRLLVTKAEARDGVQKTYFVGTSRNERQLVVKVPAGVQPGTLYRFPGYGLVAQGNSTAGTLTVEVLVEQVTSLQRRFLGIQMFVGIILLMGGLMWLGFWSSLGLVSTIVLALIIGGVGGALVSIPRRGIGAISGAIGAVISVILQIFYYEFMYFVYGRESFWNYESVLVLFISALPGYGLYLLLKKYVGRNAK